MLSTASSEIAPGPRPLRCAGGVVALEGGSDEREASVSSSEQNLQVGLAQFSVVRLTCGMVTSR